MVGVRRRDDLIAEPDNRGPRMMARIRLGRKHPGTVTTQREPSAEVFMVPAKFFESERAIVPDEDIDAVVAGVVVEGGDDSRLDHD